MSGDEERSPRLARSQRRSYNIDPLEGLGFDVTSEGKEKVQGGGGTSYGANARAVEDVGQQSDSDMFEPEPDEEEEDPDDWMDDAVADEEEEENEEANEEPAEESVREESVIAIDSDEDDVVRRPNGKEPRSRTGPGEKATKRPPPPKNKKFGKGVVQPPTQHLKSSTVKMRQRGVEEWQKGGQAIRFKTYFGPRTEDIYPALLTRNHWRIQEALPSRSEGNLRRSFFTSDEAHEKETKNTRDWYRSVGQEVFAAGQKTRTLTDEEAKPYLRNDGPDSMALLMGEVKQPKLYTLKKGEFMKASTPFEPNTKRNGWIFNMGMKVQETQWAPNEEGRTQYLAVALQSTKIPAHESYAKPSAPAFTPTEVFPASIQILAFGSRENGDMDPDTSPRLENVICTDWGAPKHFRWWPVGFNDDAVGKGDNGEEIVHLGLLAGIWSDGKLRILDVSFKKPDASDSGPVYTHYARAAFDIPFPETIPTCLHWVSGTSLAAATAAGTLAIWSLNRKGAFPPPNPSNSNEQAPKPWLYTQVADTYILALCSGYPSRPTFLSVTTGDGFTRLIDIRAPTMDHASSARSRMLGTSQAWHEHTQTFVMADELFMLKHASIRRFHANSYTMKLEHSLLCVATSPVQPCILIGGADGTVAASNATAKVLNTKNPVWQQTWFKHEWRRPVDQIPSKRVQQPAAASTVTSRYSDAEIKEALSKPLTRITEGYKPLRIGTTGKDEQETQKVTDTNKLVTIFEENSAITKVAWNPNLKFGTWAVAGTYGGYLRVEDLGV